MEKIQKIRGFLWVRYEVFDDKNLNSSAKLVYSCLMRFMDNETKECFPSIKKIATMIGLHKETIETALKLLERESYIHIQRRGGKVNKYTILEPSTSRIFPTGGERGKIVKGKEGKVVGENGETNNTNLNNTNLTNTIVDLAKYKLPIEVLNELTGRNFKLDNLTSLSNVRARVKDGSSLEEICEVIKFICKKRMGTEFEMYLRPSTVFNKTKYENYKEEYKFSLTNKEKCDIISTGTLKDLD